MGKEITHECSNLRKIIFWRKIPSSELSFIALYQNTITRNSESASFTGLVKSLVVLWVVEETRQTWPMFSELKALVDSERFRVIVFQYRAENDNSELGFFTSKYDLICKSKIPSYRFSDNSELGIFTSKHDSTCHKKFRVIVFMYRAKNDNSEFGIHLTTNSEISENPSYHYGQNLPSKLTNSRERT